MRLKYIKLSGFKSFVDVTKVSMPNNLIGIVGPNGCGKSNVIDAMRWVMGESSAKTLRGDSMDDVIFNGSSARKPVNRASVELVFDNKDGSAPGSYAKFAEISIRRELIRDGGSKYFINKTRCRRKDIQDIFLGTGLGPRSYSIIEQGMVGRIVESKPEELRVLIEEAAGISKYKERRKETENRIRHTRDNLSRVEDIISELKTQLRRLKRQANDAQRYTSYKQQQREKERLLKTIHWDTLHQKVQQKELEAERLQTDFESQIAEQREVENQIEQMREEQTKLTNVLNKVQGEYYSLGGEISSMEQSIEHETQTRKQRQQELDRLNHAEQQASQHLASDKQRLQEAEQKLEELTPKLSGLNQAYDIANRQLKEVEKEYSVWQENWESINRDAANPEKEQEVQLARLEQYQKQKEHFKQRETQLIQRITDIDDKLNTEDVNQLRISVESIDKQCADLESQLVKSDDAISKKRIELEQLREKYNEIRHQLQDNSAQLNSLKSLQAAALGENDKEALAWLDKRKIDGSVRVAGLIEAQAGWEKAVDTVLGKTLNAISVKSFTDYFDDIQLYKNARLFIVDQSLAPKQDQNEQLTPLANKVTAENIQVEGWFQGVYVADTLMQAMELRSHLSAHESIVTKDGSWLGTNWVGFGEDKSSEGVLQREAQIESLQKNVDLFSHDIQQQQNQISKLEEDIKSLETNRETSRSEFRNKSHSRTELHNKLSRIDARSTELVAQRENAIFEQQDLNDRISGSQDEIEKACKLVDDAKILANTFSQHKGELQTKKESLAQELASAKALERDASSENQAAQIEVQRLQTNQHSLQESIQRLQSQLEGQIERRTELTQLLNSKEDPTQALTEKLKLQLEQRIEVERKLNTARTNLVSFEDKMKNADQQRLGFDRQSKVARDSLESVRMAKQELVVRRDTIAEQLKKDTQAMSLLAQELDEQIKEEQLEQDLADLVRKIERIGAVNLVAVDEYKECEERKIYLDKQQADLEEAMATLENAINKIDKETKTRFKETFDNLNEGFKQFFPRLFGGGSAYLELTSNDMLDTGVSVMARPPGKRNSTIHLLSGGEKALTAVSLLFAFFDLNPAPFCVLDEVDAPLDDANVERYANVLKQLGKKTQLMVITHNKITMEVSDILVGVTMAEPGVSRLVSVDVSEAAAMVAQ